VRRRAKVRADRLNRCRDMAVFSTYQDGGRPTGAIGLNFGVRGHIADLIAHPKFCDNRFEF